MKYPKTSGLIGLLIVLVVAIAIAASVSSGSKIWDQLKSPENLWSHVVSIFGTSTINAISPFPPNTPFNNRLSKDEVVLNNSSDDKNGCLTNTDYTVIERLHADDIGADILVKRHADDIDAASCDYVIENNDFEIEEGATYVLALVRNLLILDIGTGPEGRQVKIYDLDRGTTVHHDTYEDPIDISNNYITYWRPNDKVEATKENCPADVYKNLETGMGMEIQEHVAVSLSAFTVKTTGEARCVNIS